MKRIAYSFLLIFALSCGSSPRYSENRVTVLFRDSTIERESYFLLSVRNETIVVSLDFNDRPLDALIAHARVIPFQKIEAIYYHEDASFWDVLLPGVGGCFFGAGTGCAIAASRTYNDEGKALGALFGYTVIGEVAGFVVGLILGEVVNTSDKTLFLDSKIHIHDVRKHAVYREAEPSALQKIE